MKGILLAGGHNTRLYPATFGLSKHLLLLYDKPMVYYSLSTLMLAGIRDILVISTPYSLPIFKHLLGNGSQWGITLQYASQPSPDGIAQALIIGESFIGQDPVCLALGDNFLYGEGIPKLLQKIAQKTQESTLFGYYVRDPERYGVVSFDEEGIPTKIVEKPTQPDSGYAVIGLYFYTNEVVNIAKTLRPSARGELEITDINQIYLEQNRLHVEKLGRGIAWLDTGTHESLLEASNFIHTIERRQGLKIGSPEEIAWRMNYICSEQLQKLAEPLMKSGYGEYLMGLMI